MDSSTIRRGACILAVLLGVALLLSLAVPERGTFAVDGATHVYDLRMPRLGSSAVLVLLLIVIYAVKQAVRFVRWTGGGIAGLFTRSGPSVGSTANTEPTAVPIVHTPADEFIPEIATYHPPGTAAVLTQDVSPAAGLAEKQAEFLAAADDHLADRLSRIEATLDALATHVATLAKQGRIAANPVKRTRKAVEA